jgi:hypothetical protein
MDQNYMADQYAIANSTVPLKDGFALGIRHPQIHQNIELREKSSCYPLIIFPITL